MAVQTYTLTLMGETELLMDRDNLEFAATVVRWQKDPTNKDQQHPGDDRSPAWLWLGKFHFMETPVEQWVSIPESMLAACVRDAATAIPHPTARGKKSLKEVSQAAITFTKTSFPILVHRPGQPGWSPISYADLSTKLGQEEDVEVHSRVARDMGFRMDIRRAAPQFNTKHVRVRPMFGPWCCICNLRVTDDVLDEALILQVFEYAGRYKGLGNWRPSTRRAGSHGTFSVSKGIPKELEEVSKQLG